MVMKKLLFSLFGILSEIIKETTWIDCGFLDKGISNGLAGLCYKTMEELYFGSIDCSIVLEVAKLNKFA